MMAVFLIFLFFFSYIQYTELKHELTACLSSKRSLVNQVGILSSEKKKYELLNRLEGINLGDYELMTQDGVRVDLEDLVGSEPRIVIVYNILGCSACYLEVTAFWTDVQKLKLYDLQRPLFVLADTGESDLSEILMFQKSFLPNEPLLVLAKEHIHREITDTFDFFGKGSNVLVMFTAENYYVMHAIADSQDNTSVREEIIHKWVNYRNCLSENKQKKSEKIKN